MTLAYLQTRTVDGRAPLQRWDRMTQEQQQTVAAYLRGDSLTPEQQAIVDTMGTPQRLSRAEDDGMVTECLVSGIVRKNGAPHEGTRPSENVKNGLPPPGRDQEPKKKPDSMNGGNAGGNRQPRKATVGKLGA